jgi:hypothetical protein
MPKPPLKWIVTANFTVDGAVGYFTAARAFSRQVSDALVFATKEEAEVVRQEALRAEAVVTDPYLTEVVESEGKLDLLSARERIRSLGPTVPYGYGHVKAKSSVA